MTQSIGIGVPVYNGEDFLADCLQSIVDQDYEPLDVLISDNASSDSTAEICRDFVDRDSRFRYVLQPDNLGAAGNYNYVMRHSQGEFYKAAAHDDLLGSGFLELCSEALETHPDAVLAFPRTRYVDTTGSATGDYDRPIVWTHADSAAGRLSDLLVEHHSSYLHLCYPVMGVMRRSAALASRGIQPFQGSDMAMLVELALLGDFIEVPEPLYLKRLHDNTSMRANVSAEEFALWYDPNNAGRDPMPISHLARSHMSSVWREQLTPGQRAACTAEVIRWFFGERRWRVVGSELRATAKARLGSGRGRSQTSV